MDLKRFSASVVACCTAHPLELIKVRMQLHGEPTAALQSRQHPRVGPISMGLRIIHQDGTAALFSGVSAAVLGLVLRNTSILCVHHIANNEQEGPNITTTDKKLLIAGGLITGGFLAVVGNPAEVAMVRMQADGRLPLEQRRNYKSAMEAISKMIKNEGFASPWRGTSLAVIRGMVATPSSLMCHQQLREIILERELIKDRLWVDVAASAGGGMVAAAVSNPVDVIKTRVMNMQVEAAPYRGAVDCAVKTYKAEGLTAFYKGLIPSALRQGVIYVVGLVTLEQLRNSKVNMNITSSEPQ